MQPNKGGKLKVAALVNKYYVTSHKTLDPYDYVATRKLVRPTYFGYTLQNFYQVIASPCGGG
jgi:hypothetical protein